MTEATDTTETTDLLPGTLDMLVLKVLEDGSLHGYAIAIRLERLSREVLRVEEGSLYPALYRMERRGWLASTCTARTAGWQSSATAPSCRCRGPAMRS